MELKRKHKYGPNLVDKKIGENLRKIRIASDISQDRLGQRIGVSFQQVQKIERGINRLAISRIADICDALDCNLEDVLHGTLPEYKHGALSKIGGIDGHDVRLALMISKLSMKHKQIVEQMIKVLSPSEE